MNSYDVVVRGAGAVGMTAALALSRQGLQVGLVSAPARSAVAAPAAPAAPASPDVRAYALNAASVALLQGLKVWGSLPADARTAVHDMRVQGDAPGAQLAFSAWTQGVAELAWIVDAAELEAALRAAVRYAPHVNEAAEDAQARLQLLAEGRDSATRQRLGVRMRRQAYGQRGVAARLVSDQPHAGQARQWFRSPDVLALLPMDRPQAGRGLGLVWSLPDERADEVMALADADFEQALMEATGGAAGALRLASARAQWPLLLGRAEAVCGPGWALLGDAAHLVHPLAGQGLNLGLADVASLVRVVAERESWRTLDDPRLLRRYAREREAPTRAMGQVTDGLLRLFASQQPVLKVLRNRGMSLVDAMGPLKRALTARALNG